MVARQGAFRALRVLASSTRPFTTGHERHTRPRKTLRAAAQNTAAKEQAPIRYTMRGLSNDSFMPSTMYKEGDGHGSPQRPLTSDMRRTLFWLMIIGSALACVAHGSGPIQEPLGEAHEASTQIARVVGLPNIEATVRAAPIEHRFEVRCSGCLPDFLFRIQQDRRGRVRGAAFVLWFMPPPDDTSATARNMRRLPRWCASPLQPSASQAPHDADEPNAWCRARIERSTDWRRVLSTLDSLGITRVGNAVEYKPSPPATNVPFGAPTGCSDLAGSELELESRDAAGVRRADFWCLENAKGAEFQRAAAAERFLLSLVPGAS